MLRNHQVFSFFSKFFIRNDIFKKLPLVLIRELELGLFLVPASATWFLSHIFVFNCLDSIEENITHRCSERKCNEESQFTCKANKVWNKPKCIPRNLVSLQTSSTRTTLLSKTLLKPY